MISRLFLSCIFVSSTVFAGEFSGFAKISSNYIWRGLSFSENQPAIGLNANYTFDSGFYGNLYGTNLKFKEPTIFTGESTREMDLTAGYLHSFNDFSINIFYNRYEYLDHGAISTNEYAAQFRYKDTTLDYAFQPNWFGYNSASYYVRLSQKYSFNNKFHLIGSVGRDMQEITNRTQKNGKWEGVGFTSYFDYSLALQVQEENNFTYEFQYTNTNRKLISYDTGTPADDGKKTKAEDEALTVSLTKAF